MRRKAFRRRSIRVGLLFSNFAVLGVILAVVLQNPHTTGLTNASVLNNNAAGSATPLNPLDQVSSADIALTVARMDSLSETTAITNQAESQAAEVALASSNDNVVNKPQVVATALKSRADIQNYTTVGGDTVTSIAAKFSVTSDSIRWSNGLNSDSVAVGRKLVIPPVNGIVYTVKPGDTADSLASQYRANRDKIIAYNDAEIGGLKPGEQIIIPDATRVSSATASTISTASTRSFPWGSAPMYGFNGYDYGYCTWYVATQIAVPGNWGNANTWSYYASMSGWHVSSVPTVGAIAQTPAGWFGHVAIVDAVSADGTQIQYRDMNGIAGWGRVGYSGWVPTSRFPHYITH
jgi:surface antigen